MEERIPLKADVGMVYTNGTDYGTVIYLAEGVDPASYYKITEEEYLAAVAAKENKEEESYGN